MTSSARLLEKPGALREACDIIHEATMQKSKARDLRRRVMLSSFCDCDLIERRRSTSAKKMKLGTAILSSEYSEASRHFTICPLYVASRAERRFSAQLFAGIGPYLPMLVHASLTCTTGAGGFSISPQLSFRLAADPPVRVEIIIFGYSPYQGSMTIEELDYTMEKLHRRVQQALRSGELSPYNKLADGSTLLHVGSTLTLPHYSAWSKGSLALHPKLSNVVQAL